MPGPVVAILLRVGYEVARRRVLTLAQPLIPFLGRLGETALGRALQGIGNRLGAPVPGPGWFRGAVDFYQKTALGRGLSKLRASEIYNAYRTQIRNIRKNKLIREAGDEITDEILQRINKESDEYAKEYATTFTQQDFQTDLITECDILFEELLSFGNVFPFIQIDSEGGRQLLNSVYLRGDPGLESRYGVAKREAKGTQDLALGEDRVKLTGIVRAFGSNSVMGDFLAVRLSEIMGYDGPPDSLKRLLKQQPDARDLRTLGRR